MSTAIKCILQPPLKEPFRPGTDGKNLADAYLGAALGGFDIMAFMQDPNADLPEDIDTSGSSASGVFAPIEPFIDKRALTTGAPRDAFFPPSDGIEAIDLVIAALNTPEGSHAVPIRLEVGSYL